MKRQLSVDVIERWLKDSDCDVRQAAMYACQGRTDVPTVRTFEPPEKVYKQCLCGVIVVAKIPQDAHVRGTPEGKCRADKAKIIDVIGEFAGEQVGISIYDGKTTYFAGDEVVVEDFDFRNKECSTGFHFFCTREQAERF